MLAGAAAGFAHAPAGVFRVDGVRQIAATQAARQVRLFADQRRRGRWNHGADGKAAQSCRRGCLIQSVRPRA